MIKNNFRKKKYTVHFEFSSGDGGLLSKDDFNKLEREDLRNCSTLNICFEPEEISISDVKITKIFIHYDGITYTQQDYFGFKFEDDLDQGFKGSPSPIVTFELNKKVDPDEFRQSIWMSSISIFPEKVRERNGEAAFQQDNNGYTSIIDRSRLDEYISQLSGAAIVPPKEISFPDGLDGYYKFELRELIGLNSFISSPQDITKNMDKDDLLLLLDKHGGCELEYFHQKLKSDREFILAAVINDGTALEHADDELKSDWEIVLAAVTNNGTALEHADEDLKSVRDIVLAAVVNDGTALEYADEKLKSEREIVLAAVINDGSALEFADEEFKSDREIVLTAVRVDGSALDYVDEKLKSDREIVLTAATSDIYALEYADEKLKSDREIVLEVANKSDNKSELLDLVDEDLKSDQEIVSTIFREFPGIVEHIEDKKIIVELEKKFGVNLVKEHLRLKGFIN